MVKSADEFDAEQLLNQHLRQVERRCRRKYGAAATKAQILEVLRDLMLQRLERFARTIAQLAEETGAATRSIEVLNRVIVAAIAKQQPKGKKSRAKRS